MRRTHPQPTTEPRPLPRPLKEIFRLIEARTEKTASCWLWQGYVHENNGPMLCIWDKEARKRVQVRVRHVVWTATQGPIARGDRVTVHCGVSTCIAPAHLRKEDASTFNKRVHRQGGYRQAHWRQQFSDACVQEVVQRYWRGESRRQISAALGVSSGHITAIIRGRSRRRATGIALRPPWELQKLRPQHGEAMGSTDLTWQAVLVIVGLRHAGYKLRVVAETFGISEATASRLCAGKSWTWLTAGVVQSGT